MVGRTTRSEQGQHRGRSAAIVAASAALVIGLLATVGVTALVAKAAHQDEQRQFDETAAANLNRSRTRVQLYFDRLRDIGSFVSSAPGASSQRFSQYVEGTHVLEQLPSMSGIFFVHRIDEANLPTFLERTRTENPGFAVFPIGEHAPGQPYYLLSYYAPGSVDLKLPVGTDVGPIHSVTDLIESSRTTGDGVAGSFQQDPLLQDIASKTNFPAIQQLLGLDFFIGIPVSEPGPDGTRGEPVGWVGATISHFDDILASDKNGEPDNLGLSLAVDLTKAGNTTSQENISRVAQHPGNAGPIDQAAFRQTNGFQQDGVDWSFTVWQAPDATRPVSVNLAVLGGLAGSILLAGIVYLRMRARQRDQLLAEELADREQFQRDMLDSVANAMVVLDRDGVIMGSNPAWRTLLVPIKAERREPAPAGSRTYLDVLRPSIRAGAAELEAGLSRVLAHDTDAIEVDVAIEDRARHRWYAVRATPLRSSRGGAVVVHTDITERKRSHDELELKATHDSLTGVLNRAAFEDEVDAAMAQARAQDAHVAVLFIDLDGFKPINDTYGHAAGDDVLRAVAQRVSGAVRTSDRVARLGGDEFVVLISPLHDPHIAESTANRILHALEALVHVGPHVIPIGASIGIAVVEAPLGGSHETLIHLADEAMYNSKQAGGGRFTVA